MNETPTVKFEKVNDRRGQPVLGLWIRRGLYYYQTRVAGEKSARRIPLKDADDKPVVDLKGAQQAILTLRKGLAEGTVVTRKCPPFDKYADHYLKWVEDMKIKTKRTLSTERPSINGWKRFLGSIPLNHITKVQINAYAAERKKNNPELSNQTINLDVNALDSVLKLAVQEEILVQNVAREWTRLPYTAPKRTLKSFDDIEKLCAEALRKNEKGKTFTSLVRRWSSTAHKT